MSSYYFKENFSNLSDYKKVFIFSNRIGNFNSDDNVKVDIFFSPNDFLNPDALVLLVNLFNGMKLDGIKLDLTFHGKINYASVRFAQRVNFFEQLNIKVPEDFQRHDSIGRFLEITKFDGTNIYDLQRMLIKVLDKNARVEQSVLGLLHFCFNEILDNVLNHSEVDHGWVSAQYFPSLGEVRICICDSGIGIHKALTSSGRYSNYEEVDSVKNCINLGVTNGKGQGFGLYATSEFIKRNRGVLVLQSGDYRLNLNHQRNDTTRSPRWKGTFIMISINTRVSVRYNDIFPAHRNLEEEFMEYKERFVDDLAPINETLW